ncbi:hypothetical protein BDR26DRAFT_935258 [Obelidium mucronatum]|nr:hypothetical protein BDR26DRAFT_935258 [Obelidium mucronatum]
MPAAGVPALTPNSKLLTSGEILRLASIFVKDCGVEKIRLTGGEPTVRKDLLDIVDGLNQLRQHGLTSIGMTTNGLALKSKLPQLKEAGLDHLNISLDTLSPHMFELLTRRRGHQSVLDSVYAALDTGFSSVKLNNVVMNGINDHEVVDFVELTRNNDLYVRFIEYMPFDGNQWSSKKFVPYKTSLSTITKFFSPTKVTKASDDANDTSKAYKLEGFKGKFGFITSMSEHFCSTCSRIRLLADGNLKVCLFGNNEVDLRAVLRSGENVPDEEVIRVIEEAVRRKKKQHAGMENLARMENRPMRKSLNVKLKSFFESHSHVVFCDIGRVNVSSKTPKHRTASAQALVRFSTPEAFDALKGNALAKGDVLGVARLAGINAAKQTGLLVPLAHPLQLTHVALGFELLPDTSVVQVICSVECVERTGVEVEAMLGASVAAVTIFDMCKAVDKGIVIEEIRVRHKTGGKSDYAFY